MNDPRPALDDPARAAFAWRRYRRLLGWMAVASVIGAVLAIQGLQHFYGPLGWVAILATLGGVIGSVMMAGALMGLVFLSSGTGHDADVDRRDNPQPGPCPAD
ncbi:hypothetical protein [Sphingomonas aracearum]|uniref:Uncharacterized protein n=1 Tax=Sphingomonas aracearum TaxID=2283317 RepID=A0A369VXE3_9SPHN|nr:hypothetical protein [Sphingomonas aracearum]RDE04501.1 hypothetical protein DVW87_12880 [Sphingomonas aracearum]